MALLANALVFESELSEARLFFDIGIADTSQDDRLITLINHASAIIEQKCNRKLIRATITDDYYSGSGTNRLILKEFPAVKPTSIVIDDGVEDTTNYAMEGVSILISKDGRVFPRGDLNIKLTYQAGYLLDSYERNDLKAICLHLMMHLDNVRKNRQIGTSSKSKNSESITLVDGIPLLISELLEPYKRFEFYATPEPTRNY